MADHYGSAELIVGKFMKKYPSKKITVLTKWCPKPSEMTENTVRDAVERRLKRLQTKQIDLLQFHWWNYRDLRYIDAMNRLVKLQKEGKIRYIGVTNFDTAHLRVLLSTGYPIVTNQIHFSLLDRRAAGKMTNLCLATGCRILAFGCLAGGLLTERYLNTPRPPPMKDRTDSISKYLRFVNEAGGWERLQELLCVLDGIAKELKCTIAHVAAGKFLSLSQSRCSQTISNTHRLGSESTRCCICNHRCTSGQERSFQQQQRDLSCESGTNTNSS